MVVTVATKKQVIARDLGVCMLALPGCTGAAQTTDHRANRGAGGSDVLNHPANLVGACALCNAAKADGNAAVLADLERRGLYIRKAATNTKTLELAMNRSVEAPDGALYMLVSARVRVRVDQAVRDDR